MSNTVAPQTMNVHEVSSQLNHPQLETSDRYLDTVEGNKQNIWAIMIQIQGKPIVVKVEVIKHCQAIGRDKNITLWPRPDPFEDPWQNKPHPIPL